MDDASGTHQPVPSGMISSTLEDYKVSLIVVVPPTPLKNKRGVVDEILYVDSLGEAKQKQEQITKRRHSEKRRIIVASIVQEVKNFSDFE